MPAAPEFIVGMHTSLKIKTAGSFAIIKGLNKAKMPGMERTTIDIEEFGREWGFQLPSGGKYTPMSFGGNVVKNDLTGQDVVRAYLHAGTKMTTDFRFYEDLVDFLTCNLAGDAGSGFYFTKFDPGEVDKNGVYSLSGELVTAGEVVYMRTHNSSAYGDIAFVVATTPGTDSASITDASAQFVIDGFAVGQTLEIEGSTSNDGQYTVLTVAAGTIELIVADTLTSEAAIAATKLHGGTV